MSDDEQHKSTAGYKKNSCGLKNGLGPQHIFIANMEDVATALIKILKFFGIFGLKLKPAKDVIIDTFTNYDEEYHRIELIPKKRIRKANLMHGLGSKCSMTLMEAQLTYSVLKRAFRAYYHGTDMFGNRDPSLDAQQVHTRECLWVHAAKRTAQVFAEYEGMFFSTQKKYEELLKRVYIGLNNRLNMRACGLMKKSTNSETEDIEDTLSKKLSEIIHNPRGCTETLENNQSMEPRSQCRQAPVLNLSSKVLACEAKCPPLSFDCDINLTKSIRNVECSQGPFICRWVPVDDDDTVWDPCFTLPDKDVCTDHEKLSESVSEMTFEEKVEEEFSGFNDDGEGVESSDDPMVGDSYTCQQAIPNLQHIMLKDKIILKKKFQWEHNEIPVIKRGHMHGHECFCTEIPNRICAKNDDDGEIISKYNDDSDGLTSKYNYVFETILEDQATDFKSRIESNSSMLAQGHTHKLNMKNTTTQ